MAGDSDGHSQEEGKFLDFILNACLPMDISCP
jgi:hypothetical protein